MDISIAPLSPGSFDTYITVGTEAYNQHYLHLWKHQDSSPYIQSSFTYEVLTKELPDTNNEHYIIYNKEVPIGILKLIVDSAFNGHNSDDALLLQKIYILHAYSGKGIGSQVIAFVKERAKGHHKKIVWLDTMKNGPAYFFYRKHGFKVATQSLLEFPGLIETERKMYQMYLETSFYTTS